VAITAARRGIVAPSIDRFGSTDILSGRYDGETGRGLTEETLIDRRPAPSFNVGILLERRHRVLSSGMSIPDWSVAELLLRSTEGAGVRRKTTVDNADDCKRFLWTGFELNFYRDGGESYWHTLVGEQQELFVVCQDDEEDELAPILVTADYDEAMAYQEADDTVLSTPMPPVIYQTLERFVLENYAPEKRRRRKRKDWHNADQLDEPFARHPDHK
jgi:hypothetical protein